MKHGKMEPYKRSKSLNPYSTGSNSNQLVTPIFWKPRSLNPYSTGSNSNSLRLKLETFSLLKVLILILLEVTQINHWDGKRFGNAFSLNPYSTGSNSNEWELQGLSDEIMS